MARTVNEIYDEIAAEAMRLAVERQNQEMIDMLDNDSKFSLFGVLFYIMAYCIWVHENLFEKFMAYVNNIIALRLPHKRKWYREKALAFQFGYDLIPDKDYYDNTGLTTDQINASKVVKYAAVNEATIDGKRVLLVKVAGTDGSGNLVQLTTPQEEAFKAYMEEIRDAGVYIVIYNRLADTLKAVVTIFYNPLLLDANGNRLDGQGGKPVEEAAKNYLLQLPFNGEFSNAAFVDTIQSAYGVAERNVFLTSILRRIAGGSYQAVPNTFISDAGYVTFDSVDGLIINYTAHVQ